MRQIELFRSQFPNHTIITDIGSGLNFKRKGLQTILDDAIKGNLLEIVVTHKDRLCRFGFEVFERILSTYKGRIVVLNQRTTSPQEELVNDLLSIITVFSARLYGLRAHSIKKKLKDTILAEKTSPDSERETPSNGDRKTTIEDNDGTVSMVL
jgi:predicted site-specific integrase-resolvase